MLPCSMVRCAELENIALIDLRAVAAGKKHAIQVTDLTYTVEPTNTLDTLLNRLRYFESYFILHILNSKAFANYLF